MDNKRTESADHPHNPEQQNVQAEWNSLPGLREDAPRVSQTVEEETRFSQAGLFPSSAAVTENGPMHEKAVLDPPRLHEAGHLDGPEEERAMGQELEKEERPSVIAFLSFLFIAGYIVLTIASSGTGGLQPVDARDGGVSGSIIGGELTTVP
ncbi:hypothetical protein [Paenibacillus senegalensis]|uniref:hypothetical protein n=1 Tax=Paenibacillus senegalensis TaxID=1465766 RepID=UPI0002885079|nr:hypothetical protein [Paenibacillus senegalensis]